MNLQKNKTVFIEYSSADEGQHFMTVVQVTDGKRQIIGRIFREYDKNSKQTHYHAVDWAGNAVFFDIKDLHSLKQKFVEHGKNLAALIPMSKARQSQKAKKSISFPKHSQQGKDVKKSKEGKTGEKVKGHENEKPEKNIKNQEQERLQPSPEMYDRENELRQIRGGDTKPEIEHEQQQEIDDTSEKSDRDLELEEIRGADDDNGQEKDLEEDQERDIDI